MFELSKKCVRDDLSDLRFDKNSYIVMKHADLKTLYSLMNKNFFKFTDNIVIENGDFLYIDDVVNDHHKCTVLENFIFDILENQIKPNGYLYFCFAIKNKNMQALIDEGVCEWLEYMMLYFKFTRLNIVLKIQDEDVSDGLPIAYQMVKKINNPRLSLFCDISRDKSNNLPEDIDTVTKMIGVNVPAEKFVYSNLKIT